MYFPDDFTLAVNVQLSIVVGENLLMIHSFRFRTLREKEAGLVIDIEPPVLQNDACSPNILTMD